MVKEIILIDAGGHAKFCWDVISKHKKKFKFIGLVENKKKLK